MNLIKTDNTAIQTYREALYKHFNAPLDGMWENLYIANAQPYLIEMENTTIGYCCIDDEYTLLQLYVVDEYNYLISKVIRKLIDEKHITSASLSSIEPITFNACLLHSLSIKPNTLCFQYAGKKIESSNISLTEVAPTETEEVKTFLIEQISFDDNFGYTEKLIRRGELFMYRKAEEIIATGECRYSDTQANVADLGVVVNKAYHRKGIAKAILNLLAQKAVQAGKTPICSTTFDNIASQKAIEGAGFYCSHIIFDISFQ